MMAPWRRTSPRSCGAAAATSTASTSRPGPWPTRPGHGETFTLLVQVNGKVRDRFDVSVDTPPEEIEQMALASVHVQRYLAGRAPMRVIQVPGKLVNVVTPKG